MMAATWLLASYFLSGNGISQRDMPIVTQTHRECTSVLEQVLERHIALLATKAAGRPLHAQERDQRAVGAENRRGDRVQVGLPLLDRLRPSAGTNLVDLLLESAGVGDSAFGVALERGGRRGAVGVGQ